MLWWRGFGTGPTREACLQQRLAQLYATLDKQQLSYGEPGMTHREDVRRGFRRTVVRERVGNGEATFRRAYDALLGGQMHRRAGLGLFPTDLRLSAGTDFVSFISSGPITVANPCRVIAVLDEPLRASVSYGTLPGHPLCGEEEFLVELESGGTVWFVITAVSKPGALYAHLGAPLTRRAQSFAAHRFMRALRSLANQSPQNTP